MRIILKIIAAPFVLVLTLLVAALSFLLSLSAGVLSIPASLLGILSVMFPLLSRFENSFAALLRNTVLLSLANLPRTLGLGFINAIAIALCVKFIFPLFFLPALAHLFSTWLLEPMFKPYMPQEIPEDAA